MRITDINKTARVSNKPSCPPISDELKIKTRLEHGCKELTKNFHNYLKETGHLQKEYVIETRPIPPINIFTYNEGNRKQIAYIGYNHWSSGVLLPSSSNIEAFTNQNGPCPILIMDLDGENQEPYIFLAHVYCNDIDEQINKFITSLTEKHLHPTKIVFSPDANSEFQTSEQELQNFSKGNLNQIIRTGIGSALVTNEGWAICESRYSLTLYHSDPWGLSEI